MLVFWLTKKIMRHRMKRIQSKLHKIGAIMIAKFLCFALMIKGSYQMMVLIAWLILTKI